MTKDKNTNKKVNITKNRKRIKINLLNILIILLAFSLLFPLIFKNQESFKNILTKTNKQKAEQTYTANDLKIGDIVYYNHMLTKKEKTNPEDKDEYIPVDEKNLKVTFGKGDAENPGTGVDKTQTFDASNEKVVWKVWDINKTTGEVTLVSDKGYPIAEMGNAIGYIWSEHNMHKAASTMGYGYGANKDTNYLNTTSKKQEFTYSVGSGIESELDNAEWKIGENGIQRSGSRALTLNDIEEKLKITEEKKKELSSKYVKILSKLTKYPQRKVKELEGTQEWDNENEAIAKLKKLDLKNEAYSLNYNDVLDEEEYKKLVFEAIDETSNDYYNLATKLISIPQSKTGKSDFVLPYMYWKKYLNSRNYLASENRGRFFSSTQLAYPRFVIFLKPEISYFKATGEENAWDILKVNSQPKDLEIKATNLTKTDEKIKINLSSELNGKDIIKNPEIKEINVLANKNVSENTTVPIYSGQIRTGKLYEAEFVPVHNKYKVEIAGLPENSTYKIIGVDANGYIDLSKVSSIEAIIYPKAGDYKVPVEYSKGENADDFSVSGNLKLMNGKNLVKSQTVKLEHKKGTPNKTFVTLKDIDMFNNTTNELNEYEVVFEKTSGRHKVEVNSGKITVTYVPENMEITVSAKSDGPITLDNITVNLVKKIGENITKEEIILENASGFTKKITVPKTDNSGNVISYSIEKKSLNMGYITNISGYDVNLKPVLALPFTGSSANLKILVFFLGITALIGIVFRHRKKMNYIPNGIIK